MSARVRLAVLIVAPALSLACLLLAGCGSEAAQRQKTGSEEPARPVRVAPAEEGALPRVVRVTGTLAAEEQVVLGMKVAGRLSEIRVDLGSRVARGDVLARLAPADFDLRLRQADAALAQARSRLGLAPFDADGSVPAPDERVDPAATSVVREAEAVLTEATARRERARALERESLLSPAELDAAEASYRVAESRYQDAVEEARTRQALLEQRRSEQALARQQLADSVLHAPFDGAVRERHAAAGQFVAAGQPVVTLVKVHPLRLRLAVPERDAAGVRAGQEVRLAIEGAPPARGRVARLSPAITESNRTLLIEAEIPNEDGALRPGAFASAEIVTGADERAILVPASAIVTFAGLEKVLLVDSGRSVEKRVRTGRRLGERVEIVDGLAGGETVITDPGNLTGGRAVAITQP